MPSRNEGTIDRVIRVIVGIALLIVAFGVASGVWAAVAGVVGAIALVTGVVGFCPLYRLLHVDTSRTA